jgi:hypothetical protein
MPRFHQDRCRGVRGRGLGGLTRPVDALSFEFTTIQKDVAGEALSRVFDDWVMRDSMPFSARICAFVHDGWVDAAAIGRWIDALPHTANSGDIYAVQAIRNAMGSRIAVTEMQGRAFWVTGPMQGELRDGAASRPAAGRGACGPFTAASAAGPRR